MTVKEAMAVPFVDLARQHASLREELLEAAGRVIDHGQFILGSEVEELESRWADLCQVKHAVGVSSGTAALVLSLKAFDVGPGDEVVTAPNSFVASASAIALVGATPRFADVGNDFNIDPLALRASLSDRTKAVIPVHLTGRPADMNAINDIAAAHNLVVIEDAAQAMGAEYGGQPVGGLTRAACFSLHPLKTAGACGDAGMITTNDSALDEKLRLLRNHGITKRQEDCSLWGFNARMDTLQAALALVKLEHFDDWTYRRRANAAIYRSRLSGIVQIPEDRATDRAVYHTFPVEADRRDELIDHLSAHQIGCAVHYRVPLHLLGAAKDLGYQFGDFPKAERQAESLISLPIHEGLASAQIHHACDVVEAFYAETASRPA